MPDTISSIENNWLRVAEFGTLLFGIVAILVTDPPIENFNPNTIKFLVVIIAAFALIPVLLYNAYSYFKKWLFFSIISFFVALAFIIGYNYTASTFIVDYQVRKVVIGTEIQATELKRIQQLDKEENQTYEDGSDTHNFDLLSFAGGNPERVWDFHSIKKVKIWLLLLFYGSIAFTTILLLCIMQTLQLLFVKKQESVA